MREAVREWTGVVLQLAGALALVVGFAVWLGPEGAWIAGGIALLVLGTLLEMLLPKEEREVIENGEGAGEAG